MAWKIASYEEGDQGEKAQVCKRARKVSEVVVKRDQGLVAEAKAARVSKQGVGSCDLVIDPQEPRHQP